MKKFLIVLILIPLFSLKVDAQTSSNTEVRVNPDSRENHKFEITMSEDEWKEKLTPEQYEILRQKGTEYAFSGEYYLNKKKGTYLCAACGNELFSSDSKYNSGSGWPSFFKPIDKEHVLELEDNSMGMDRTEVVCSRCGGHLGHVFPDGPKPTGLRYCVNSAALEFRVNK